MCGSILYNRAANDANTKNLAWDGYFDIFLLRKTIVIIIFLFEMVL